MMGTTKIELTDSERSDILWAIEVCAEGRTNIERQRLVRASAAIRRHPLNRACKERHTRTSIEAQR